MTVRITPVNAYFNRYANEIILSSEKGVYLKENNMSSILEISHM